MGTLAAAALARGFYTVGVGVSRLRQPVPVIQAESISEVRVVLAADSRLQTLAEALYHERHIFRPNRSNAGLGVSDWSRPARRRSRWSFRRSCISRASVGVHWRPPRIPALQLVGSPYK